MRAFGVVLIVLGAAAAARVVLQRVQVGRVERNAVAATAGVLIGLGAAAVQRDPGAAWLIAPIVLGSAGAIQAEFLFAAGGPLRTSSVEPSGGVPLSNTMAQTVEEPVQPPIEPAPRRRLGRSAPASRRTRVVIRRVGPISILKFSLIFYLCVMLVFYLAFVFLWGILSAAGLTLKVQHDIQQVYSGFAFNSTWIFERLFALGVAFVIVGSLVNTLICFMYNLISDLVGGIEITLAEKR